MMHAEYRVGVRRILRQARQNKYALLCRADEALLIDAYQKGIMTDAVANTLVLANIGLLRTIAIRYANRGVAHDDLMAAGMDAIMVVLPKMELARNNKLSTVLVPWVHQRMRRAIENTGRQIRLPAHMHSTITHVQYAHTTYVSAHGVEPDTATLSQLADVPVAKVEKCLEAINMEPSSLVDSDSVHHGRTLVAPDVTVPHLAISDNLRTNTINACLGLLPPRSKDIIVALHGLDGADPITMTQLAVHYRVSRDTMRKLIAGAYQTIIDAGYTLEAF